MALRLVLRLEQSVVPVGPDVWLSNEFKTEESCWCVALTFGADFVFPKPALLVRTRC